MGRLLEVVDKYFDDYLYKEVEDAVEISIYTIDISRIIDFLRELPKAAMEDRLFLEIRVEIRGKKMK